MTRTAENGLEPESVWDYPRPPAIEPCRRRVLVEHRGEAIADSRNALRVLETSSPPTIYIPADDVRTDRLEPVPNRQTFCEWKGAASYFDVGGEPAAPAAAWSYPDPRPDYAQIRDHYAFYPGKLECFLDQERVAPQAGNFYGGWITAELEGPFKGDPGTSGW